jgi:hypothetical protein
MTAIEFFPSEHPKSARVIDSGEVGKFIDASEASSQGKT